MESRTGWSFEEEKAFEKAILSHPELARSGTADWAAIAESLPGKTAEEVAVHFGKLLHDLSEIESGRVMLPSYTKKDPEKRKGVSWTKEEHMLFLEGLGKYGKSNWRSIARNCVKTKTPTQVASHAQKFYLRHKPDISDDNDNSNNNGNKKKVKKRLSIHDLGKAEFFNNFEGQPTIALPISQVGSTEIQEYNGLMRGFSK